MFIREGDPRRTWSHGLEEEKEEEQEEGGSIDTPAFSSFILFYGTVVVTEGVPIHNSISQAQPRHLPRAPLQQARLRRDQLCSYVLAGR